MAQKNETFEPAFAWAILTTIGSIVLLFGSLPAGLSGDASPYLWQALLLLGVGHFLTAAALVGAMAEPLPRKQGDRVPLQLRASWAVLAMTPPPTTWARTASAFLMSVPLVYGGDYLSYLAAGLLVFFAWVLGLPKDIMKMEADETVYFALNGVLGAVAFGMALAGERETAWRGVAVLALQLPLVGQRVRELTAMRWKELLPGVKPPPALDLSRYALNVETRAPAERPALPPGVEAQLVDQGSFRVDAGKMLDKLRGYQLREPRDFILAWLRCAVASGAEHLVLTRTRAGFELRFDGRPFSSAELSQPYQVLVDGEGENAERGRHFAYGLLALYRLAPAGVAVTSRGENGVAALSVGRLTADPDAAPTGTVVRVEWPVWGSWWRGFLVGERARQGWGLCRAYFTVDGRAVPERPAGTDWREVQGVGWHGVARRKVFGASVRLYHRGALVEVVEDGPPEVEAWLTHEELRLDISQSRAVRGAFFDRGMRVLKDAEF